MTTRRPFRLLRRSHDWRAGPETVRAGAVLTFQARIAKRCVLERFLAIGLWEMTLRRNGDRFVLPSSSWCELGKETAIYVFDFDEYLPIVMRQTDKIALAMRNVADASQRALFSYRARVATEEDLV